MARSRDEDEDDRPRRRDDDDASDVRKKKLTGLDGMFANTSMVALILFGFCCGDRVILGVVGLIACKDEKARSNALIVTIIAAIMTAVGVAIQVSTRMK